MKTLLTMGMLTGGILAGLGAACDDGVTQPTGNASMTWRVQRTSSGGLTGLGAGSLSVTSDGTLSILPPGRGEQPPTCTLKLTTDQLSRLTRIVESADLSAWRGKSVTARCCDMILYTLKLERRQRDPRGGAETGQSGEVSWYSEDSTRPSPDVEALNQALNTLVPADGCPM